MRKRSTATNVFVAKVKRQLQKPPASKGGEMNADKVLIQGGLKPLNEDKASCGCHGF
ncbi:hypothetical protein ACQKNB_13940 [Lysinibacillus xylanilyticus]|uniref:hypothetical protein n=1 Tax=Lysinibacillus xylanilyticus TaxID=582475 RepID=UPI003D077365